MALGLSVASDLASALLTLYIRGGVVSQTMQERPLLRFLNEGKKTFPGGKDYISGPVQGAYMSDTAGFIQGYAEDEQLTFRQAANIQRWQYAWKEMAAGLIITWTELKKDGITINDDAKVSEHSQRELFVLSDVLKNRIDDFAESWARTFNSILWNDGTQDSEHVPGVRAIITDVNDSGSVGGIDRAVYTWWRHRTLPAITPSATDQTLTKKLRSEKRMLRRYGGRPNKILAGSAFIEALELEVTEKGTYTDSGFANAGKNDIDMADISMRGIGRFEYDPTLDDIGRSKEAFFFDSRHITLRPMEGEDNKVGHPTRPYDYAVFLQQMFWTGALQADMLNCHGHYYVV